MKDRGPITLYYYQCPDCSYRGWAKSPMWVHFHYKDEGFFSVPIEKRIKPLIIAAERPDPECRWEWAIEVRCMECGEGWRGNKTGIWSLYRRDFHCSKCNVHLYGVNILSALKHAH